MALKYVILEHMLSGGRHFDLMLEVPGQERLRTIQLQSRLSVPGDACSAKELDAHRRAYLEYEGEVSGNRGVVRRVEQGSHEPLGDSFLLSPDDAACYRLEFARGMARLW